jgi:hypothetical protein
MSQQTNISLSLPRSKPDLKLVFNQITREIMAALACAQTGTITAFYPTTQTADIIINMAIVLQYLTNADTTNTPVTTQYPPLYGVPVVCLGGGGGAITFPVKAGDTCALIFLDRDMDSWWLSGTTGLAPNSNRLHNLSDAIAIVGLRSQNEALPSYSTTDTQVYGSSGPSGPLVSLGTTKVGISNASMSLLTAMNDLVSALTALNAKTGPDCTTQITKFQNDITALLK